MFSVYPITLFPEMFPGPLAQSLAGKALNEGRWKLETIHLKNFAIDRHKTVDAPPCGGGAGLVLKPDILDAAISSTNDQIPLIYFTPRGQPIRQNLVKKLSKGPGLRLICGRYEGVDERILEKWRPIELSLGDYILSGGEIAALALIDSCVRLVPGVMGNALSGRDESFENGLLEYPLYTKPSVWDGRAVPNVLLSGDHQAVESWRLEESKRLTKQRRPDLWASYETNAPSMDRDDEKEKRQ